MYLICGEALFDVFVDDATDDPSSLLFTARAGGSPFNVSIGISRLGKKSALLTGISSDRLGRQLVQILQRESVSTEYLLRSDRRTTLSLVNLDDSGTPEYSFYGEGSADCGVQISDLPEIKQEISGMHFGSYSLVINPVADAFAFLLSSNRGRFISLDPNVRPTIEADMDIWRERIQQYSRHADLLKLSLEDMDYLYPDNPSENVATDWLDKGVGLVVVTYGGNGCIAWSKTGGRVSKPALKGTVVDTVGAGDSFQAALLTGMADYENPKQEIHLLNNKALDELITRALTAACITCSRRGADLPSAAEVQTMINA
ncbi:MAG: carbohydrate kinase [Gammaproteobacteria bacterium]|nr:carbohydrate kinase [Gammaproteobacteria bacterium]